MQSKTMLMPWKMWVLGVNVLVAGAGCAWQRQTVPLEREAVAIRVPQQQRLVAMAVERAVESLDFSALAGKSWKLEINGVFPHSRADLLDYVETAVARRLGEAGATVAAPKEAGATAVSPKVGQPLDPKENRLAISVTWGGIDTSLEHFLSEKNIELYAGVGGSVFLAGVLVAAVASFPVGMLLIVPASGWFGIFPYVADLTYDTYTLTGRVRLAVSVFPGDGKKSSVIYAEGETQTIVDPAAKTGYMLAGPQVIRHTSTKETQTRLRLTDEN